MRLEKLHLLCAPLALLGSIVMSAPRCLEAATTTPPPSVLVSACSTETISGVVGVTHTSGMFPMGASYSANCADTGNGIPMPVAGTLQNLMVATGPSGTEHDPSDGLAVVVVNGVATNLSCALGNNTRCSDRLHSVSVRAGDLVEVQLTVQTYSCGTGCAHGGYTAVRVTLAKR